MEGDIKGFFDNINHTTLIKTLRRRIVDERFINLIEKFLKSGYLEDWVLHKTYSGTPQGGLISPILSNIYLNELDSYMADFKKEFDTGRIRSKNSKYRSISYQLTKERKYLNINWACLSDDERENSKKKIRQLEVELMGEQPTDPQDETFRRIQYTCYADDFIIGVIGSKADAENIKQDLVAFLAENLQLELSLEKTLITHSNTKA